MPLVEYDSSDEESFNENAARLKAGQDLLVAAPDVVVPDQYDSKSIVPLAAASIQGITKKNLMTGYAEEEAFDPVVFKAQKRLFDTMGVALDPSIDESRRVTGITLAKNTVSAGRNAYGTVPNKKRKSKGELSVVEGEKAYKGPWAGYSDHDDDDGVDSNSEDQKGEKPDKAQEQDKISETEDEGSEELDSETEETEFLGKNLHDYLGRTYMHVPQDLDVNLQKEPGSQECFIPKKKIHTWEGHYGGVTRLRFFPRSGHLLLSCGNDSKVKLWDVYHDRELLRSYNGHSKAVKDIDFNKDGTQFLSCSFDRYIKLWDTETGSCISKFNAGSIPNTIRFNPLEGKQSELLAGLHNRKIIQLDIRTKDVVQQYDHHLGPVNTITFVDNDLRFMTTSDDKSIRIWDWGINAPIKFIADPYQHSMPSVRLHPSGKYVAAESMDNRIMVFGATDRFRPNKKKQFTGLSCAGYAVGLSFSPDGRYLMSGDNGGMACFWDWKSCSMKSKFKAHTKPVLCIEAHPQETSKVVTAGLDSVIHYWD